MSHGTHSAGVATLFSANMNVNILNVEGRLLLTQVEYEGIMFVFVNVYAPNSGPERQNLFMTLRNAFKEYDGGVCLVIGETGIAQQILHLTGMGRSLIVNQVLHC